MNNSFAFWALLLGGIGLIAWFSFACYIVPILHPGTKRARFFRVAGWVILVLGVGSRLYTRYSDRERQRQADSWVVMSLAPITIEDLAPSPDKIPDLTSLVNDPEFLKLTPKVAHEVMRRVDPSLEYAPSFKLAMLTDLLTRRQLDPLVTVEHHGNIYTASCSSSKVHYTDPDMPQELANRDQPCGTLVRQYVGKTIPEWPSGGQKPAIGIQLRLVEPRPRVGVSPDPNSSTLSFVARPNQREEYSEEYRIWSVDPVQE